MSYSSEKTYSSFLTQPKLLDLKALEVNNLYFRIQLREKFKPIF